MSRLLQSLDMAHYLSSSSNLPVQGPPQPSHPSDSATSAADARPTLTTQQSLLRVQGQGVATSRNQQNVPFSFENNIQLQLGLRLPEDYWKNVKRLKWSDVDRRQGRFLLQKSFVEDHILPYRSDADQCSSAKGLWIDVWDVDVSREFVLCLKQWPSSNSYVLVGSWIPDFVTRKGLKKDDEVGLTYLGSTLYFKHFKNHN